MVRTFSGYRAYHKDSELHSIDANPPEFFGRLVTSHYKQKTFTLRIGYQIIQKLNFYISGVILIFKIYKVGSNDIGTPVLSDSGFF